MPPALAPSSRLDTSDLLKARGIGGVFDLAFDIYRQHFGVLMTIVAVMLLPMQAVLYLLFNLWLKPLNIYAEAHSDDAGAGLLLIVGGLSVGWPAYGVPGLLSLLVLAAASAPAAIAIADIYRSRVPTPADCCRRAFARIPRVLLGWIVAGLAFTAVASVTGVACFLLLALFAVGMQNRIPDVVYTLLGIAVVLIPLLLGMTLVAFNFSFTAPLIILENTGVTQLPSRCWQLIGKPRALRTWAAIVFLPVVFFTVQMLMLGSISSFLSLFSLFPALRFCVETALITILILFLQPYLLVFLNVLYFDARIQREGLDIHILASAAPPDAPLPSAAMEGHG